MPNRNASYWHYRTVLLAAMFGLVGACAVSVKSTPTVAPLQQLRVTNSGSEDIQGLTLLFPGPTADALAARVQFGDIPAGKSSGYVSVASGVYSYAAYEYRLDSRLIDQPVIDWVGENPMSGARFTYQIKLDSQKVAGGQIQLVEVLVDVP